MALDSWRALAKGRTPYFVYAHGMLDPYFNKVLPLKALAKQILWWFSEGHLVANASNVFFATEEERRLARQSFWLFRYRERVVAFGTKDVAGSADAQIALFRTLLPQLAGRQFILFLSRIHPKKGRDLLIQAFAKAAAENKELDLVMAGPDSVGWGSRLIRIAEDLGVADRIHWPGMLRAITNGGPSARRKPLSCPRTKKISASPSPRQWPAASRFSQRTRSILGGKFETAARAIPLASSGSARVALSRMSMPRHRSRLPAAEAFSGHHPSRARAWRYTKPNHGGSKLPIQWIANLYSWFIRWRLCVTRRDMLFYPCWP